MDCHHPLAQKENLSLLDLKDEPFVVISEQESPGGYRRLIESCAAYGFTPNIVRAPRSLESLLLCVEMGVGIAMLDQNTRLELSPYIVTIPQNAEPMAVVAVVDQADHRPFLQDIVRILTTNTPEQRSNET
jgi:DNA-binding transcriptional LysR family regulator